MKFLFSYGGTAYYRAEENDVPEEFESSVGKFTDYYRTDSLQDMRDRLVRMYVAKRSGRVVGYATLAMTHIGPNATEETEEKGANVNISVLLISHLAVHKDLLRRGIVTSFLDLVFLIVPNPELRAGCRYVVPNPRNSLSEYGLNVIQDNYNHGIYGIGQKRRGDGHRGRGGRMSGDRSRIPPYRGELPQICRSQSIELT